MDEEKATLRKTKAGPRDKSKFGPRDGQRDIREVFTDTDKMRQSI